MKRHLPLAALALCAMLVPWQAALAVNATSVIPKAAPVASHWSYRSILLKSSSIQAVTSKASSPWFAEPMVSPKMSPNVANGC